MPHVNLDSLALLVAICFIVGEWYLMKKFNPNYYRKGPWGNRLEFYCPLTFQEILDGLQARTGCRKMEVKQDEHDILVRFLMEETDSWRSPFKLNILRFVVKTPEYNGIISIESRPMISLLLLILPFLIHELFGKKSGVLFSGFFIGFIFYLLYREVIVDSNDVDYLEDIIMEIYHQKKDGEKVADDRNEVFIESR